MVHADTFNLLHSLTSSKPVPGETDIESCHRVFGGRECACRRCGTKPIFWIGICDTCDAHLKREADAKAPAINIESRLDRAGVPKAYQRWTWKGCTVPENVRLATLRDWDGSPPMMVIAGPTGVGKTVAAICIARDWLLNGKSVQWFFGPDWLDEQRWLEREGGAYPAMRETMNARGLVVLDELFSNRSTEYGIDRILQLLDGRLRVELPTLVTTNLRIETIDELDPRIASRLEGGRVVKWLGKDRRRTS